MVFFTFADLFKQSLYHIWNINQMLVICTISTAGFAVRLFEIFPCYSDLFQSYADRHIKMKFSLQPLKVESDFEPFVLCWEFIK